MSLLFGSGQVRDVLRSVGRGDGAAEFSTIDQAVEAAGRSAGRTTSGEQTS